MTTGFIGVAFGRGRGGSWRQRFDCIVALVLLATSAAAGAVQVGLAGVAGGKAILIIDGSKRTLGIGQQSQEGVRLVAIDSGVATIEVDGQRRSLRLGQNVSGGGSQQTTVLTADSRGHFMTTGIVNGYPVRFVVDTGASTIAIGASEARRLGLKLAGAERSFAQTANGVTPTLRVRLDSVRIGDITLEGVEASVVESELPVALLGMSFLNRMDMKNESGRLTLMKRY